MTLAWLTLAAVGVVGMAWIWAAYRLDRLEVLFRSGPPPR
jgi:hypothetical protein